MDIEEIKCPLCSQVYDESDKVPVLLPDCGHSFCLSCIQECFTLMKEDHERLLEENPDLRDDPSSQFTFRCPDDE